LARLHTACTPRRRKLASDAQIEKIEKELAKMRGGVEGECAVDGAERDE